MRPLLKMRLNDKPEAWEVMRIMAVWKQARTATVNIIRAITLYEALLRGDASRLSEYFPGFGMGSGMRPPARRMIDETPVIELVSKSDAETLDDALSFFDGLEMGG